MMEDSPDMEGKSSGLCLHKSVLIKQGLLCFMVQEDDLPRYQEINIKGSMSNSLSWQPLRKLEMCSEQLNLS